jgi:hypothetical protein
MRHCEIFEAPQFLSFSTQSAQSRPSHAVTAAALIPSLAFGVRALRPSDDPVS